MSKPWIENLQLEVHAALHNWHRHTAESLDWAQRRDVALLCFLITHSGFWAAQEGSPLSYVLLVLAGLCGGRAAWAWLATREHVRMQRIQYAEYRRLDRQLVLCREQELQEAQPKGLTFYA